MCAVIPLLAATLFVLAARQGFVRAEDSCYYPDGSVADKDIPCGSSSSDTACCPYGWTCLDTGICSLDSLDYITRYTCTDQSWDSSACPQYCLDGTPNGTDTGNVALLECSDNQYCCNGDRSGNCCKDKAVSLFEISPGFSTIDNSQHDYRFNKIECDISVL
ncbi:hypothetical protein UCDDS831_g05889 [Diplodia seriata]|uniref:Uncharacterized protein n=1 Tax=Diplodia seriata TaxID=420778 RepID=A0A0G2G462_9PEZI|nr:hypothetical protein UCDDS831_g05889 [Diplodia seriata]